MSTMVPPATHIQPQARWTPDGVNWLRRIMAGEVYTGLSGEALALFAVGIHDLPRGTPHDAADFARCMNVYWSAPIALQAKMLPQLEAWDKRLRDSALGVASWRWRPVDLTAPTYYEPPTPFRQVRL